MFRLNAINRIYCQDLIHVLFIFFGVCPYGRPHFASQEVQTECHKQNMLSRFYFISDSELEINLKEKWNRYKIIRAQFCLPLQF